MDALMFKVRINTEILSGYLPQGVAHHKLSNPSGAGGAMGFHKKKVTRIYLPALLILYTKHSQVRSLNLWMVSYTKLQFNEDF
jgi:hypothetical protein